MNTLLFTLEYPPQVGGVAEYYGNLSQSWPEQGGLVVLDNNNRALTSSWLWPHWLPALEMLYRRIRRDKIGHILVGQILPLGTVAYYVTKLTRTPYSVFLHGMDLTYALRVPRKNKMARKILNQAENIICASTYTAKLAGDFLGTTDKIKVVNPGVGNSHNLELITHNPEENSKFDEKKVTSYELRVNELKSKYKLDGKIVLFSVGRLVKRKGFDTTIKAMAEVAQQNPRIYYFLAGDGPDKKYIFESAAGIPNIVFLGKISEEDKWAWLSLCDVFVMPARSIGDDFEGFGIVYLEANLCGKPVIAGDSGGVRDAVKGAVTGIIVDPNNIERLAGAIITLASDAKLRQTLGEQGRARAIKEFGWEKQAKTIFGIVNNKDNL